MAVDIGERNVRHVRQLRQPEGGRRTPLEMGGHGGAPLRRRRRRLLGERRKTRRRILVLFLRWTHRDAFGVCQASHLQKS
ncbi:hypothetical protein LSTR_LSTR016549 [Laodelphax striatellus]|uniref:Uncharacterized protein n=1 Tax=Laodelphax striatellus TaxID=195883 RepID=A0A482WM04_LAOST|nr:hypothetical protein LSTR_LSTR016549 [Laodelphax striatellus]